MEQDYKLVNTNMGQAMSDRKTQILETMLALAGDVGPDRVRTKALAERVGVTEPALYRHFPGGKGEMWRALAGFIGERMAGLWQAVLSTDAAAPERLRRLILAQLGMIKAIPGLPGILFSRALHAENPALRAGVAEVMGRLHGRLQATVEEGQRRGEIRADVDAEAAAWLLIAVAQGTAVRWSITERGFDIEAEGGRLLEVMLTGLAPVA